MSRARNVVKTFFGALARTQNSDEFFGFLGNRAGTVKADKYGNVWVLMFNGQVVKARNKVAPLLPRLPVAVGYTKDDPKLLQVLRVLNVYNNLQSPYVPPHADTHTWPGVDTVSIRAEQFLPGLAVPAGGMTVQYYGWPYSIDGVWHFANHKMHDFTSYIPASGAVWVGVEINAAGSITYNQSTSVESRDLLGPSNLAITPASRVLLFAVKCYVGQSEVIKTQYDSDLFDPRFVQGGGNARTIVWGEIAGTLADQTDLKNALDEKMSVVPVAENITDQVDGTETHFVISVLDAPPTIVVYLNGLRQLQTDVTLDEDGLGFTLAEAPLSTDILEVEYLATPLQDAGGGILSDSNGYILTDD